MTKSYSIKATNGQHLRDAMRRATADDVEDVLARAAEYIGETSSIERLDDGRIMLGALVATPDGRPT